MNILFAAGDVGGARAVLPVARLAAQLEHSVSALAHGTLHSEGRDDWNWFDTQNVLQQAGSADVVVYATSVTDKEAIKVASVARAAGKPCVHVLDNWSSYAERIRQLMPDAYTVMDKLALDEARAAGVPADILHITGHPDLAKLADEKNAFSGPTDTTSILFVSEPAARDGGTLQRGYDEAMVMQEFFSALSAIETSDLKIQIAPHPREDRQEVEQRAHTLCAHLDHPPSWSIVSPSGVRSALHGASHVIGMSSILLYEAWLLGRPVLSLQPGLRSTFTRSLSYRSGLIFHDRTNGISEVVAAWLDQMPGPDTQDVITHRNAAQSVLTLIEKIVSEHNPTTSSNDSHHKHIDLDAAQPACK